MTHSKDELLDYVIRYMAVNSLEMNTFEQMKFACFADWLQKQDFCKPDVSGRSEQFCNHDWVYRILHDHTAADVCTKCKLVRLQNCH